MKEPLQQISISFSYLCANTSDNNTHIVLLFPAVMYEVQNNMADVGLHIGIRGTC